MVLVQPINNSNFTIKLTEKQIKRYSRQMVLKKIGPIGQKKLLSSKILELITKKKPLLELSN